MKVLVVGAGGMGGYIGGRLAHAGRDVTFIQRGRHLWAMQQNGLHVQSPLGDFVIEPVTATDNPEQVGPVDLILICVKSYDVLNAAKMLKPLMTPDTVVIPVQNGVEHIQQIGSVLGAEHVLGGVSLISAQMVAPGSIEHHVGPDSLEFGEMQGGYSARCEMIEKVLAVPGFKAGACPSIVERMWWKLAAYSGACVFCVVRGDRGMMWATAETKELYRQAIAEAVAVAQAKGIPLADSVPNEHVAILDSFRPHWKPSMLTDLERGHRLELESLDGVVCAIGRELGVPTPVNDFVHACLKPYVDGRPQAEHNQ